MSIGLTHTGTFEIYSILNPKLLLNDFIAISDYVIEYIDIKKNLRRGRYDAVVRSEDFKYVIWCRKT